MKEIDMDVRLMIQSTPNPNALKFVLSVPVKTEGNFTYKSAAECDTNPLAKGIFELGATIREVYFFDNYITVTQDGSADWEELETKIKEIILAGISTHDPSFITPEPIQATTPIEKSPEMEKIDDILNQTVRPALQMDGGDIQLISYKNNQLQIFYQGACGSCPSASMGTLAAIENILKDQFNPDITVALADLF